MDERIFRELILESAELYCIARLDGSLTWVSPQFEALLGWSAEELCARPFLEFVHRDDAELTRAEMDRLRDGQPTRLFENRCRTQDEQWVWLQWSIRPSGSVLYCCARDVSTRKRTDRIASRRERYLQLAEGLANCGHWHLDLKTNALEWSDEVFKIHGLPVGASPSLESAINYYHPDDRKHVEEHMAASIQSKSGFRFELRLMRADGTVRFVEARGRCELDDGGDVVGLFGVFMDITERIEVQRELERQSRKLRQFVHVASHDLQEPLRMVTAYMDLLRDRYADALDERGLRFVGYAHDGARRMKTLVDDVLTFSRSSPAEPERRTVSLQQLIETVRHDLTMLLDETGGRVVCEGELPRVESDPTLLSLVLQNLLNNAVKFRREGIPPVCTVSGWREGDDFGFVVADNGIGIPPEQHERIFEPFRRLHRRERYAGNGIGLSIVQDAVDALGGSIRIESLPGEGSRFIVEVRR